MRNSRLLWLLEPSLLALTGLVLVAYTYGYFARSLQLGFDWSGTEYEVIWAFPSVPVKVGDKLVRLGEIDFQSFGENLRQSLLDEVPPGETVPLVVKRGDELVTLSYTMPGLTRDELQARMFNQWWLAWLFGVTGLITFLLVRPKDTRWRLLIAFFCLSAIWLAASNISRLHLWESAIVLRMAVWLSVPVYWHLHWLFPQPLQPQPRLMGLMVCGYLAALVLAGLEWFQLLPANTYTLGFLLAFLGIVILLSVRLFIRAQQRGVRFLWIVFLAALAPSLALGVVALMGAPTFSVLGTLLGLPLVPLGYFYAAYRRQSGWFELRANRILALYLFGLLLTLGLTIAIPVLQTLFPQPGEEFLVALVLTLIGAFSFESFQRFVERRLLGIPLPTQRLLGQYVAHITASLDRATLARVLSQEILPSLLVRQSALMLIASDGAEQTVALYTQAVPPEALPRAADLPALIPSSGRYRDATSAPCPWARVVLRLIAGEKTLGLWLLGRRDPDDSYAQSEIDYLQVLADQTALALTSLLQTEQLRELYQANIDQREAERTRLARDLHDVTLNQLAILRTSVEASALTPRFLEAYARVVESLRQTISDLRPPLLDYGLYQALKALVTEHEDREGPNPELELAVPESAARYDLKVEAHLYRVIQQAYENALAHACARKLVLRGILAPVEIDLALEDDGMGFATEGVFDASSAAARKHFGLRGMRERAMLIGAELQLTSEPGRGTRVHVRWKPNSVRPGRLPLAV